MLGIKKYLLACAVMIGVTAACKKDGTGESSSTGGPATLNVTLAGIQTTFTNSDEGSSAVMSSARGKTVKTEIAKELYQGANGQPDVELTVTAEGPAPSAMVGTAGSSAAQLSAKTSTQMAAVPMAAGTKYKLLLIKSTTPYDTLKLDCTAGTAVPPIPVNEGDKYEYIALTYNNQTMPDDTKLSRRPLGSFDAIEFKDFSDDLYFTEGTLKVKYTENPLPLTFTHTYSKMNIVFDSRGVFAPISQLEFIWLTRTTSIYFDRGVGRQGNDDYPDLFLNNQNSSSTDSVKSWTLPFYPLTQAITNGLRIDTSQMYARPDNTGEISPQTSSRVRLSVSHFSPPFDTQRYGQNITFTYKFIGPVIGVKPAGEKALIRFSPGNLYYDTKDNGYRFRAYNSLAFTQSTQATGGDFWQFNSTRPYDGRPQATMAALYPGDPCALVKPYGAWRLPTTQEWAKADSTLTAAYDHVNNWNDQATLYYKADFNRQYYTTNGSAYFNIATYGHVYNDALVTGTSPNLFASYWAGDINNGVLQTANAGQETINYTKGNAAATTARSTMAPAEYAKYAKNIRCVRSTTVHN